MDANLIFLTIKMTMLISIMMMTLMVLLMMAMVRAMLLILARERHSGCQLGAPLLLLILDYDG